MTRLPNRIYIAAAAALMALGATTSTRGDMPANDWRGNAVAPQPMAGDFGPQATPQPRSHSRSASSDFPDDTIHDTVMAYARWGYARAAMRRAERELDNSIRNAQLNFEQSSDYRNAVAEEKRAHDAFTAEREKALKSVVSDPKYLAALHLRDQTGDQLARYRENNNGVLPASVTLTLASQKLRYASDAHNLEVAALQNAENVKTAQAKLVEASSKVSALRQTFDNSVRNNPQIAQAREHLEDARMALAGSEAYLAAAQEAAAVATDYSYFRHRWDGLASPVVAGGYGYGPYGGFGY